MERKKRRAQLIICCCFSLTYSFFSSPQKELKWCNLFFSLVRKLLLRCSPSLGALVETHGLSHTERRSPQTFLFTCTFAHKYTPWSRWTNIVQVHPREHYSTMHTVLTYTQEHLRVQKHNICHISVEAIQPNSILKRTSISSLFTKKTVKTKLRLHAALIPYICAKYAG